MTPFFLLQHPLGGCGEKQSRDPRARGDATNIMQTDASASAEQCVQPDAGASGTGADPKDDEFADMHSVELLTPGIVVKFLAKYDTASDGGALFMRSLPGNPIVKHVLAREPHSRSEYMMLSRLFLHWCTGCGIWHREVKMSKCPDCEVAYFCSPKCVRRAHKLHHEEMCPSLRVVHDTLMPEFFKRSTPEGRHELETRAWKRKMLWRLHYLEYALLVAGVVVVVLGAWSAQHHFYSIHPPV